jgi:magnesium-transporting ATPase (P-type)
MVWVFLGASVFLMLVVYVPFLNSLFRLEPLSFTDWCIAVAAGIASVAWSELVKLRRRPDPERETRNAH